ncbi:MAG: long-chain fatty acid--CoA ligase [Candidatus Riflebacteria bacterium]|nr:long-chain fatty acid--CoA ligase [Candidatus Riflebacteria bacterium]
MYVGDWLERWALLEPRREALVISEDGGRHTYGELHERTLKAERWLIEEHRVAEGDRVAVLAKNSTEHLELFFACARLGAILVPLNWRLAGPELAFILTDSTPRIVLVEKGQTPPPVPAATTMVELVPGASPWGGGRKSGSAGPRRPGEAVPLMILYTSGTTGQPKGAVLTHRSIFWNSINTSLSWDLSGSDSTLTHTPFFHTGGWNVLTLPLLHRGGRVVLTATFDAGKALGFVERERLTLLFAVPTMFDMMRQAPEFERTRLDSLRFAISGGAPCPDDLSRSFLARGVRFKQGYGLTEVGPNCFAISLAEAAEHPDAVGYPIHNETVRVVRDDGTDCGPEEIGELVLSGPHVCAGYWNRPQTTAAAAQGGWFHTGDLVRRDTRGLTYIVGRKKEMFISGGENVYPAEVERVLLMHPEVVAVAVVGVPHPKWGEVGRAFLVTEHGRAVPAEKLKEHCRQHLARYKVPHHFEFRDKLPMTSSGKIAKAALAAEPLTGTRD